MQQNNLSQAELEQIKAVLAANSFRHFVEYFWHTVSSDPFKGGFFVDTLCEHLQAVRDCKTKRLAIACPVDHGKSTLTEVFFPSWCWIKDPTLRFLTVSHGEKLALRDATRARRLIQSEQYQRWYGSLYQITDDQNTKSNYQNDKGGYRIALGTSSLTSGEKADIIIADDILDYDKAKSEAERRNVQDYWEGTLTQRLAMGNGKDRILLIGHRVHEDDVFNQVWETFGNSGTWSYLVIPTEANPELTNSYHNATGWKDTREPGQLLNPERYPQDVVDTKKKEMRHKFACLHNQDPSPRGGDRFNPEWFRYYTETETHYNLQGKLLPKDKAWRYAVADTAVSAASTSDFTVMQVWDVIGDYMILVDQLRKHLDGTQIVPALKAFYQLHKPQFLSIESEFVGRFVLDQLRDTCTVRPFRAKGHGDKETRAVAAEIRLEARKVWFPTNKSWTADLEAEILAFPNGKRDDQLDALSMAAITAERYRGKLEEELTPEQQQQKAEAARLKQFNAILNAGCRW